MTKKRIIVEVSDELHARLKAEAAMMGTGLGPHCAEILEASGATSVAPASSIEAIDISELQSLPLGSLRELSMKVSEKKPLDWKRKLNIINGEIKRRYKV